LIVDPCLLTVDVELDRSMPVAKHLREQLDACRAGTDDLALPALGALAAAIEEDPAVASELAAVHQFDRAIEAALYDVAVPDGLADRLLAALSVESLASAPALPDNGVAVAVELPAARTAAKRRVSRRALGVAAVSAAALVLGAVGVFRSWPRAPRLVRQDELMAWISDWRETARAAAAGKAPESLKIDPALRIRPRSFRNFRTRQGWQAVAADQPGTSATLFILKLPPQVQVQVATSPYTRLPSSPGGRTVVAWQRGTLLYVLVLEQGDGQPQDFIQSRPAA
jgi:hypothetical protein